jgi:hypothetical protein
MAFPQVGEPGGPFSPPKRHTGLIVGTVVVVVVLVLVALAVWIFSGDDSPPAAIPMPPPGPSASASPSDPPLLAMFKDAELREFARRGAATATGCEAVTASVSPTSHTVEAVKCTYASGYRVYYSRYDTVANRDLYTRSARRGFAGGIEVIDGDTFWTNDAGAKQGAYLTGYSRKGSTRFLYWDVPGKPLSGQVFATSTDASATEAFWKTIR